jgi:hypothetical protein
MCHTDVLLCPTSKLTKLALRSIRVTICTARQRIFADVVALRGVADALWDTCTVNYAGRSKFAAEVIARFWCDSLIFT